MRALLLCLLAACAAERPHRMLRVHLDAGCASAFAELAAAFATANPGHELHWWAATDAIGPGARPRVLFVQEGEGQAAVRRVGVPDGAANTITSDLRVGDVLVLSPGESARFTAPLAVLAFLLPEDPGRAVPRVIRPDFDPRITDTPGGCATDAGAYRRVMLTWLGKNGPYTFHGLNVHRVRMDDSFTHYHPVDRGFDELYLVQAVRPGAHLVSSERTADLVRPETIARADVPSLLQTTELRQGDLVYLPRGVVHRGVGGVLAQVITVPGFVPGVEIGIDHHLRAINERLGLEGGSALPLHEAGARGPVVR
jgi:oxalate decarboxylase/phosphoglucose isomerase-like protein (cupin superfamily)